MTSQFADMASSYNFFLRCRIHLVKFSYWFKFHANRGLTRNLEIGNKPVWVLPNIWWVGQIRDTKFGVNVSNEKLLNAAKCQGNSFYCFRVIKGNPTEGKTNALPPRLGLTFTRLVCIVECPFVISLLPINDSKYWRILSTLSDTLHTSRIETWRQSLTGFHKKHQERW